MFPKINLYRAKTLDTHEWVYGSLIHKETISDNGQSYGYYAQIIHHYYYIYENKITEEYPSKLVLVDPETIGQFINKTDSLNNDIFEGDIVETVLACDGEKDFPANIDVVEWNEEDCSFMLTANCRHFHNNFKSIRVIGNIYDNKDLLVHKKE